MVKKKDPADKYVLGTHSLRPDQSRYVAALAHKRRASKSEAIQMAVDLLRAAYPMTEADIAQALAEISAGERAPAFERPATDSLNAEIEARRWRESNARRLREKSTRSDSEESPSVLGPSVRRSGSSVTPSAAVPSAPSASAVSRRAPRRHPVRASVRHEAA